MVINQNEVVLNQKHQKQGAGISLCIVIFAILRNFRYIAKNARNSENQNFR